MSGGGVVGRSLRRGQMQTLEPIIIVITITLLLLVGGAYFLRASQGADDQRASARQEAEDLALLERVTTLPEISCSGVSSAGRLCVDREKAIAFSSTILANESLRIAYFPLFGRTDLSLRVVSLNEDVARDISIYDAADNATTIRATRTFVSVLDPATGTLGIGSLEIRRAVG